MGDTKYHNSDKELVECLQIILRAPG